MSHERVSKPEFELVGLVERLVDNVLARRRHRPQPPLAALSKRQCATASSLGISTVETAIRDGDLVARKVGKRTIVMAEDFEAWLTSRPRIKPSVCEPADDDSDAPRSERGAFARRRGAKQARLTEDPI